MLIGARVHRHGMDVHAALVGKGGGADVREARIGHDPGHRLDRPGQPRQLGEVLAGGAGDPLLEHEVRQDRAEIGVADPLAIAVDRALDLARAGRDRGSELATARSPSLWAWMPTGTPNRATTPATASATAPGSAPPLVSQSTSQSAPASAAAARTAMRVVVIGAVAVEEVLGVEDHLAAGLLQIADRVAHHREVLFQRGAQDGLDLEIPGLGKDRHRRRRGGQQRVQVRVPFGACVALWRVLPKAVRRARRSGAAFSASKNSSSFGFDPGQPPST